MGNVFCRLYLRVRIENRPKVRGPFVLVANHSSFLDPLLMSCALNRRARFMMSDVFYRSPRMHGLYRFVRVIPVALRGGNRTAMREAKAALEGGDIVAVFPEGGITRDGRVYLGNPGAVSLVLAAHVPVVPAGVIGAHQAMGLEDSWPRPRKVCIRFGDPIAPAELAPVGTGRKERLTVATARVMAEIAALAEQTPREVELVSQRAEKD